jgi:single-strand DNA-binding protein
MAGDINRVIVTGRLTKDPDLRSLPESNTSVCSLRLAVNGRRRTAEGKWEDQANFFDVTVWGAQGENCSRFLQKGRQVAVDGRLRHRQWTSPEGQNRSAVDIIADSVQFLGSGRDDAASGGNGNGFSSNVQAAESDVPIDSTDFEPAPVTAGSDEDIPF